jgi:predicted negative regulator of RcsB-dependent stress response
MRDLLAHADLSRYAGQFVWLEISYDDSRNREFLARYGATATPTFFVINAQDETVVAMQLGAMSLAELKGFLERGARAVLAKEQTPADAALMRGDAVMAQQPEEAAKAYVHALQIGAADWPRRELATASLVQALQDSKQWQPCAETAIKYGAGMNRDELFVRTVVSGMWCLQSAGSAAWVAAKLRELQPLGEEALSLPITVRDHRDAIYRTLMYIELALNDDAAALKWGDRWLSELDQIKPGSDDERSALDIARVENLQIIGDPVRILPALRASEKAMPGNYIASLRLAQMEVQAKQYDEAIATCKRGLTRRPGAMGRPWLLRIEAEALEASGRKSEVHKVLAEALRSAEQIPSRQSRENSVAAIKKMLESSSSQPK